MKNIVTSSIWVIISMIGLGLAYKFSKTYYFQPNHTTSSCTCNTEQSKSTARIQHLAIIMDGNRRWAKKRNLIPWLGHSKGIPAVKITVEFCIEQKIPYLSLYAFSLENLHRSRQELDHLFALMAEETEKLHDQFIKENIRVRFIGNRALFPAQLTESINRLEQDTRENTRLIINIMFCYGGRQEIIDGIKTAVRAIQEGIITPEKLTAEVFKHYLWTGDIPDPELIIRTGGCHRLSNFMTYQSIYSELYFTSTYWPDIQKKELLQALDYYASCQRNFGS